MTRRHRQPRRQISEGRKFAYYLGMVLIGIGIVIFVSNFFIGFNAISEPRATDQVELFDFDGFRRAMEEDHRDARSSMGGMMARAIGGMALMVVGGILMNVGRRGLAGSGVILDPERTRDDLEPWQRAKGGMMDDALSEVQTISKLEDSLDRLGNNEARDTNPREVVRIRCRNCQTLNDEDARFCDHCGQAL